jgi:hypothetical protein
MPKIRAYKGRSVQELFELPDEAPITTREYSHIFGWSLTSYHRKRNTGAIPEPFYIAKSPYHTMRQVRGQITAAA